MPIINSSEYPILAEIYIIKNKEQFEITTKNFDNEIDQQEKNNGKKLIFEEQMHGDDNNCFIKEIKTNEYNLNKINSLTLTNCGLSFIPDCFEVLRLKQLNLSRNCLKDIPFCLINGLKTIEHLNISYNYLKHFDIEIKCANHLISLDLESNNLSTFPIWTTTTKCLQIKSINFKNNPMVNFAEIFEINNKIEIAIVANCKLLQRNLICLKKFPCLREFYLGNQECRNENFFENVDFLFLNPPIWQKTITLLDLQNLNMTVLPEEWEPFRNLKQLNVAGNYLSILPISLTRLPYLETLNISRNCLSYLQNEFANTNLKICLAAFNNFESVPPLPQQNLIQLDLYANLIEEIGSDFTFTCIEGLDFEQNYCDGNVVDDYVNKKNKMRTILNANDRLDGLKIVHTISEDQQSNSSSNSEFCCEDYDDVIMKKVDCCDFVDNNEEIEWKTQSNSSWISDVTISDDEWNGNYYIRKKKGNDRQTKKPPHLNCDYDWYYFIDADE